MTDRSRIQTPPRGKRRRHLAAANGPSPPSRTRSTRSSPSTVTRAAAHASSAASETASRLVQRDGGTSPLAEVDTTGRSGIRLAATRLRTGDLPFPGGTTTRPVHASAFTTAKASQPSRYLKTGAALRRSLTPTAASETAAEPASRERAHPAGTVTISPLDCCPKAWARLAEAAIHTPHRQASPQQISSGDAALHATLLT